MGYGSYGVIETGVKEHVTQKEDFNKAKGCLETMRSGGECSKEAYPKVAMLFDNEKKFGEAATNVLTGSAVALTMSPLLAVGGLRRKPEDKKPNGPKA